MPGRRRGHEGGGCRLACFQDMLFILGYVVVLPMISVLLEPSCPSLRLSLTPWPLRKTSPICIFWVMQSTVVPLRPPPLFNFRVAALPPALTGLPAPPWSQELVKKGSHGSQE